MSGNCKDSHLYKKIFHTLSVRRFSFRYFTQWEICSGHAERKESAWYFRADVSKIEIFKMKSVLENLTIRKISKWALKLSEMLKTAQKPTKSQFRLKITQNPVDFWNVCFRDASNSGSVPCIQVWMGNTTQCTSWRTILIQWWHVILELICENSKFWLKDMLFWLLSILLLGDY